MVLKRSYKKGDLIDRVWQVQEDKKNASYNSFNK